MGIVLVISDEEVEVWFTSVAENPFLVTMIAQPPYHGGHGVVAEMGPEGSVVSGENNES